MQQQASAPKRSQYVKAVIVLCLLCLGVLPGCQKEENEVRVLTVRDKLLGTWHRNLRAEDKNLNHVIDSADIVRAPASDTLTLTLVPDASYDRIFRFKGDDFSEHGTWHLQNDDKEIVLQPSTSTLHVDTLKLDTVSQDYFRYHTDTSVMWRWGAFNR